MANTTNFGWETPDDTDLVKDGALAIRTLGSAIDTSLVDLKGGTTGQVLAKASNTDMDFTWTSDQVGIPASTVDAKGDLIAGTADNTVARLAAGTNEHRLVADSGQTTGLKYVADTTNYAIAAKGDLLVGTAADTVTALTVGTNGHVLTADSTEASGVKWAAAAGASEGPAISVYRTTDQTVTQNTYTKIQFTSENFDTDNTFNTSDYKFTPNKSGKYLVQLCIIGNGTQNYGVLYKNGTRIKGIGQNTSGATANGSTIISMNGTTDYLEFYAYLTSGTTITGTDEYTYASACYLRS